MQAFRITHKMGWTKTDSWKTGAKSGRGYTESRLLDSTLHWQSGTTLEWLGSHDETRKHFDDGAEFQPK